MPTAVAGLASYIRSGNLSALQDTLLHLRPPEAADAIAALAPDDQLAAFRILPHRPAAAVFEYLPPADQLALTKAMGPKESAAVLNFVSDDDRTQFLSELSAKATEELIALLTPEESADATSLLKYPRGVVGRLMTAHYIAIR
jgi:magnesium transporter